MKVPRFLKFLMPILVCIALIRAINGVGGISLDDILLEIQGFSFDFQDVSDLISLFRDGTLIDSFVGWNNDLVGFEGFFTNIGNVLSSFFTMIVTLITSLVKALWNLVVEFVSLLAQIFSLVTNILGFDFDLPWSSAAPSSPSGVTGGHVGGR